MAREPMPTVSRKSASRSAPASAPTSQDRSGRKPASTRASRPATPAAATPRLRPEARERLIVDKAIEHFTRHGFEGSTRELARQLGVTQPLLYRYFPSKQALIERVYDEVFRWGPGWESHLTDRSVPLHDRLVRFYTEYAQVQLREPWVRMIVFDGLAQGGLYAKYLRKMRARVFLPVLTEVRNAFGIPAPRSPGELEAEVELVWSLHASIFYLGVRKWIFGQRIASDLDQAIQDKVEAFLAGTPAMMRSMRQQTAR